MTTGRHTLVVLSGGMDSAAAMGLYAAMGHQLTAVSIDYGQRHARELDAARAVAEHYGAAHAVEPVGRLGGLWLRSGSALTNPDVPVPEGHYADESMRSTVVPNRNMIIASVAVGTAVATGAGRVVLGVHAGDHPIYPDCRPQFVTLLDQLAQVANEGYAQLRVLAPFMEATKTDIAALGAALGVPFALTWSCYQGGERHCGRCGTCVERREAFQQAGVADPTTYEPGERP